MSVARVLLARDSRGAGRTIEFDHGSEELTGAIVDWCKSLPYQKISEIRLYRNPRPPLAKFFVVLVLVDQSSYCVQRLTQDHLRSISEATKTIDIIERISLTDLPPSSQHRFTVIFTPNHRTDLLFVLEVCRAIQCVSSELTQTVFASSESFAYALLSSIARKSLPKKDMVDGTETSMFEALWKDVYLFVRSRAHGFWEKEIVDHAQMLMHKLLRIATREKLQPAPSNTDSQGGDGNTNHISPATIAAIAWVEASASKHEASHISSWDRAWTHRWGQVWGDEWDDEWRSALRNRGMFVAPTVGLDALGTLGVAVPKPTADGMASGRAAGRFPVMVKGEAVNPAAFGATPERIRTSPEAPGATTRTIPTGGLTGPLSQNVPQTEVATSKPVPSDPPSRPTDNYYMPLINHGLIPYSEGRPIWTTTLELATEIGWTAAWERSVEQGRRVAEVLKAQAPEILAENDIGPFDDGLRRTTSRLARELFSTVTAAKFLAKFTRSTRTTNRNVLEPINETTTEPQVLSGVGPSHGRLVEMGRSEEAERQVTSQEGATPNRSRFAPKIREVFTSESGRTLYQVQREGRAAKSRQRRLREQLGRTAMARAESYMAQEYTQLPGQGDLITGADRAWAHVGNMTNSPERKLRERAKREWLESVKHSGTSVLAFVLDEEQDGNAFEGMWETAWKEAWKAAWQSTWECGWKDAVAKGIEFGVAEALEDMETDENELLLKLDSYKQVKNEIQAQSTPLAGLGRMYSMCKELEYLCSALRQSIPTPHENIMQIMVNGTKKPWTKLVKHIVEGGAGASPGSKAISHLELQNIIEEQSRSRFQDNSIGHNAFIQGMAEVWEYTVQNQG